MRKIGTIGIVIVSGLAVATAFGRTAAAIPTDTIGLVRAVEAGDDNGGRGNGKDDLVVPTATAAPTSEPTAEPRDDRGGRNEAEPGDDKGGTTTHAEPGDDKGGTTTHAEPADDKGGTTTHAEPADDKGGHGGGGGHGSDD